MHRGALFACVPRGELFFSSEVVGAERCQRHRQDGRESKKDTSIDEDYL